MKLICKYSLEPHYNHFYPFIFVILLTLVVDIYSFWFKRVFLNIILGLSSITLFMKKILSYICCLIFLDRESLSLLFLIILFIVSLIFIGLDCLDIQYFFKIWAHFYLHQFKHCLPVFLKPKYKDTDKIWYSTVKCHHVCHHISLWFNLGYLIFNELIILCVKHM